MAQVGKIPIDMKNLKKVTKAVEDAYETGKKDGKLLAYTEVLTKLEGYYMDPELERGSERAEAVLFIARKLGAEVRKLHTA